MPHSPLQFTASVSVATVAAALLIFLVASAQAAVGLLPVMGIGGMLLTADSFDGQGVDIYPVKGSIPDTRDSVTDTPACEERPMLALDLDNATASNYGLYKDIQIPYFTDQWLTVKIVETNGGTVTGNSMTVFTTQLFAQKAEFDNVRVAEGGPGRNTRTTAKWGPQSGEFLLTVDPENTANTDPKDIRTTNVVAWLHALTGQSVTLTGNTTGLVNIELDYVTTTDLMNRYQNLGISEKLNISGRRGYFDCLPGAP